jgi:hypothetical protein
MHISWQSRLAGRNGKTEISIEGRLRPANKAVCVADTCPPKTLPACGTRTRARQSRHMHNKLKGRAVGKTENGTKARTGTLTTVETREGCAHNLA